MARLTTEDAVCDAAPKAGHRELLFSLVSSVLSVVFLNPISEDNNKSLSGCRIIGRVHRSRLRSL